MSSPSPRLSDPPTSVHEGEDAIIPSGPPLLPPTIQIKLHVRKGQPQVRGRLSKDLPKPVTWDHKSNEDTYGILCARIRAKHPRVVGLVWPADAHPYIQPSHHSSQVNYKRLDDDNSDGLIAKAWRLEERRLKGNGTIYVNVFIYLAASTTHATAGRDDPLELSQGAIYQQTQFLDEQVRLLNERRQGDAAERLTQFRTIRLKVNGTVVNYEVDVSSLRAALGLPDMD
ncbi:hypothetical protein BGZ51_007472 [Haplosporangium sp. Z 767]|nr:hypothetical protein BGZ51_007472 [Haplosporangium sp. Z 767]KAF9194138.1 hypothetical protein BGZ50_006617 [Haplosporangium sp. Z 11]